MTRYGMNRSLRVHIRLTTPWPRRLVDRPSETLRRPALRMNMKSTGPREGMRLTGAGIR